MGIVTAIAAQYYPVDYSAPSFSLTLIPSIFCLIGAFSLLRVRMSQDRRGILGLVTFVVSAFLLVFVIVALQLMWSGKFYG